MGELKMNTRASIGAVTGPVGVLLGLIAVVISLSGIADASGRRPQITARQLAPGSVTAKAIAPGAIGTKSLAEGRRSPPMCSPTMRSTSGFSPRER